MAMISLMHDFSLEFRFVSHHQQTLLGLAEHDRLDYCRNYAMMKGAQFDSDSRTGQRLTVWQMKELERRMTRYELISLRCIAMERGTNQLDLSPP